MYTPDLAELGLFDAVVRTGSLSAAARELGVTQQAASARLRTLERRLGIVLVSRSPAGAIPTAAGAELLDDVRAVLAASARLGEAIADHRTAGGHPLAIGASQTISSHLLPGWLLALRHDETRRGRTPTRPVLRTGNSAEVLRWVRDGGIDLGFIETPLVPDDLGTSIVDYDTLVAVVSSTHAWADRERLDVSELATVPLVVRETGSGTRDAYEEAVRSALGVVPAEPVVVLSTEAAVRSAVAGGLGPAVLSELTVTDDVALGRVRTLAIDGIDLARPLTAVWRGSARDLFGAARELVAIASESRGRK